MSRKKRGKNTVIFDRPPVIRSAAGIVGEKEGQGPIGRYFDEIIKDPLLGMKSWEEAEAALQSKAAGLALDKIHMQPDDIDYLFAGDLLGQSIATSFGMMELQIPHFGLYGACSTMGESLTLAAMMIDGGFARRTMAVTSSHFASAEKQFRFPLGYGNQRSLAATWTVTGSGAVILEENETCQNVTKTNGKEKSPIHVCGATTGIIVDYGIKDSQNMGACMAPAAAHVIAANFRDLDRRPEDYDRIVTGDLGSVGQQLLFELMEEEGFDISSRHMDCGMTIFDGKTQDTHAGGSGCGCAAVTLCCYLLRQMKEAGWHRILFVPTGALLSKVSFNEGQTIPGIAHGVILEC